MVTDDDVDDDDEYDDDDGDDDDDDDDDDGDDDVVVTSFMPPPCADSTSFSPFLHSTARIMLPVQPNYQAITLGFNLPGLSLIFYPLLS